MNIAAKNSILLVVPVKAGQQSYSFGIQETMNNTRLKHLLYIKGAAKSPLGLTNLENNNSIYVRLVDKENDQVHDHIPAGVLDPSLNPLEFRTEKIAWEKSTVFIADAAGLPANNCVMFLAIYE